MMGLNAGLFVGGDNELVVLEGFVAPDPLMEIKNTAGLAGEIRVPWKDPTAVIPGSNRILMKPPPDCAAGDLGDQT